MKWIAIIGSRDFVNLGLVVGLVQTMVAKRGLGAFSVVSGGARGTDRYAVAEANRLGVQTCVFEPDNDSYPIVKALKIRNTEIVRKADVVIAFWDGSSRGTMDAVFKAKHFNKKVIVINEQGANVPEDQWVDPNQDY